MAVGELENKKKYDYSQQNLQRCYKSVCGHPYTTSPLSADACIPSTESTLEDVSQDLFKEVSLKNQLLSQQIQQYRTLVSSLESKVSELTDENCSLRQILDERVKKRVGSIKYQQRQNILSKGLPLSLITEESHSDQLLSLKEVLDIIQPLPSQKTDNHDIDKQFVLEQLSDKMNRMEELNAFIQGLWKMKENIEPQNDQSLLQLWQWLTKIASNYRDLLVFSKKRRTKAGCLRKVKS